MNNQDEYMVQFHYIFSCLCRYMELEYVHDDGECKFKLHNGNIERYKRCHTLLHHHSGLKRDAKRNDYIKIRSRQDALVYLEIDE